ncbi:MAG: DNA replication and repair protein RecF, partial [Chitinophagaceae bacterium]
IDSISLFQFKNYRQADFRFEERIVGIHGKNGIGKTNLLDALYYLCFTKSYFTRNEGLNVLEGSAGFRLEAKIEHSAQPFMITCILRENGKKEISVNGQSCQRFASHIGRFPAVMIAPDDVQIITGGGEERRRFLDTLISQLDQHYLLSLIQYNKILQQRNSLLKSFAESRRVNNQLLEVMDEQLSGPGTLISEKRQSFLQKFLPLIGDSYKLISGENYEVGISYQSQLSGTSFLNLLHQFRDRDYVSQRTNGGIHKDDLEITLKGQLFKSMASQGQRKSMLFALKLAEFEMLREQNGFAPLLFLDDVFEKLDEQRIDNLLNRVCVGNNGQIFFSDTHEERLRIKLDSLNQKYQLITLS